MAERGFCRRPGAGVVGVAGEGLLGRERLSVPPVSHGAFSRLHMETRRLPPSALFFFLCLLR